MSLEQRGRRGLFHLFWFVALLYFDQTVSVFYSPQVFGSQESGQKDDGYHVIAVDEIRQNPEYDHVCKIDDQDNGRYLTV